MQFGQAFSYVFKDNNWVEKIAMIVLFSFFSMVPIFGLIAVAALLGYMLELIANMLRRQIHPLPRWTRLSEKIGSGANILIAMIVYNIPNLLISGCTMTVLSIFREDPLGFGWVFTLGILCCTLPLTLTYTSIAWSVLAVGIARYADTGNPQVLYEFGRGFELVRAHGTSVMQWIVGALLVNIVLIIPCIGWLAGLAFAIPWHGHMLGQFATRLLRK